MNFGSLFQYTNGFFKRTSSMTEHRLPKSPFIAAVIVSLEAYNPGMCHLWQQQFQYTSVVLLPSYPWQLVFFLAGFSKKFWGKMNYGHVIKQYFFTIYLTLTSNKENMGFKIKLTYKIFWIYVFILKGFIFKSIHVYCK